MNDFHHKDFQGVWGFGFCQSLNLTQAVNFYWLMNAKKSPRDLDTN